MYKVVSATHFCGFTEGCTGGNKCFPKYCQKDVSQQSGCEEKCTEFNWCIAYSYATSGKSCYLMSPAGSCPTGWNLSYKKIATQSSELKPSDSFGASCIVKGIT